MRKLPIAIIGSMILFSCSSEQESPLATIDGTIDESTASTTAASVTVNGEQYDAIVTAIESTVEVAPVLEDDNEDIDTTGIDAKVKHVWIKTKDSTKVMKIAVLELDDSTKVFPLNIDCEKFENGEKVLIDFDKDEIKAALDGLKEKAVHVTKMKRRSKEERKAKKYFKKSMREELTPEEIADFKEKKESFEKEFEEFKKDLNDSLKRYEFDADKIDSLKGEFEKEHEGFELNREELDSLKDAFRDVEFDKDVLDSLKKAHEEMEKEFEKTEKGDTVEEVPAVLPEVIVE